MRRFRTAWVAVSVALLVASTMRGSVDAAARSYVAAALAGDSRTQLVLHGDCTGIVDQLRSGAARNDETSLHLLAQAYARGCGVRLDQRQAGAIYKRILTLRASDPMANGYLTLYGDGRRKDSNRAVAFFRQALRQGDPFAGLELYEAGTGIQAHRWALAAARGGDVVAKVAAASDYMQGLMQTPLDRPRGLQMLREANPETNHFAALRLATAYQFGIGVPQDLQKAEYYLKLSVRLGNTYSEAALGVFYCQTRNAGAAASDSVRLIKDAQSHLYYRADVQTYLADVYIFNVGVRPNYALAIPLLKEGIAGQLPDAMDNLAYLKFNGYGEPVDFAGGIRLLRQAAALGDAYAKTQLADVHIDEAQDAVIPDSSMAEYNYQQTMQRLSQPPNQMPYPGSPAYQNVNGSGE